MEPEHTNYEDGQSNSSLQSTRLKYLLLALAIVVLIAGALLYIQWISNTTPTDSALNPSTMEQQRQELAKQRLEESASNTETVDITDEAVDRLETSRRGSATSSSDTETAGSMSPTEEAVNRLEASRNGQ